MSGGETFGQRKHRVAATPLRHSAKMVVKVSFPSIIEALEKLRRHS